VNFRFRDVVEGVVRKGRKNIDPAGSTDHKWKGISALFQEKFKATLGRMAHRT